MQKEYKVTLKVWRIGLESQSPPGAESGKGHKGWEEGLLQVYQEKDDFRKWVAILTIVRWCLTQVIHMAYDILCYLTIL